MAEFIYTMKKARKAHGDKVILDDVTLMFLPGAKIGVVGPNGAGKSTVLLTPALSVHSMTLMQPITPPLVNLLAMVALVSQHAL